MHPYAAYSNRFRQSAKRCKYDSIPYGVCVILEVQ